MVQKTSITLLDPVAHDGSSFVVAEEMIVNLDYVHYYKKEPEEPQEARALSKFHSLAWLGFRSKTKGIERYCYYCYHNM